MPGRASGEGAPSVGILDWDTEFFGFRVGRVFDTELTDDGARAVLAWSKREAVDCVYFLADVGDTSSAHAAAEVGFRLMDVRVELGQKLGRQPADRNSRVEGDVRDFEFATSRDVSALREIAEVSHTDSRFYADLRFPRDRCAALYARWIEGSCAGAAEAVLIDRIDDRAAAYVTCHLESDPGTSRTSGRIGLVAVADRARGRSVGGRLVAASMAWFAKNGADRVRVVTQGRNAGAAQLYEKAGFRTQRMGLWFHLWPL
jgi:dTDP-4-amino-4,6-dideoxy-D-galactose acyltransferase